MIGFFPSARKDECLYSLIGRFSDYTSLNSSKEINEMLFGNPNVRAIIDLPGHINSFHENVKHIFPNAPEDIINDLTLFPYYNPFIVVAKREPMISSMLGNDASTIHTRLGVNASSMQRNRFPKYCPLCFEEDLANYGDPYWKRVHQIPDIKICAIHNCFLIQFEPNWDQLYKSRFIKPVEIINRRMEIKINSCKWIKYIADYFAALLMGSSDFNINEVNYSQLLVNGNYKRGNGLDRQKFTNDFISFFGLSNLRGILSRDHLSLHWVTDIILKPTHIFHPLRHVLVSIFVKSLSLSISKRDHPFGNGPWPCFNKASDHYLLDFVKEMSFHVDQKSRRMIGEFTCACGMVYTKSFIPVKNGEARSVVRISERGEIWHQKLRDSISTNKSLREIARELGTDAKTISKYSTRVKEASIQGKTDKRIPVRRKQWNKLLDGFESNKIKSARKRNPKLYAWLYRNDKAWLQTINSLNFNRNEIGRLGLDWDKLDLELIDQIATTIKELRSGKFRGRITRSLISKILNKEKYLFSPNLSRIPRTKLFLERECESKEQFQIRRIRAAAMELASEGETLAEWKVMRKAGIRNSKASVVEKELKNLVAYEIVKTA